MTPTFQQSFLVLPLAALGCGLYPPFETPDGTKVKVRVKLLDTVRFIIVRWSHEPDVVIGLPLVAGVPMEQIEALAKDRLREEYDRRHLEWPAPESFDQSVEQPSGQN